MSLSDTIVAHQTHPVFGLGSRSRQTALDNEGAAEEAKAQTVAEDGKAWPWSDEADPAKDVILVPASGDLAEQMRHAKPIATTITKEEWLEKRKAKSGGREMKPHGRGQGTTTSKVAIGTLSQVDALKLLAATAEVDEYEPPEGGVSKDGDQYHLACAVVELCGFLALTVLHQTTNLNCELKN